jgi:hypothetical protein
VGLGSLESGVLVSGDLRTHAVAQAVSAHSRREAA